MLRRIEMRRSKLESYEAILEALVEKPLNIDKIAYRTNIDCTVLARHLDRLIKNGLVEERPSIKKTVYAITERGIAVFKTLNFQKYLEKVTASLRTIDDALQTMPLISKSFNEQTEKTE
jgi:predicted transcriptional regulator